MANEIATAGPAYMAAAGPEMTKMPAPMVALIPTRIRCPEPKRWLGRAPSSAGCKSDIRESLNVRANIGTRRTGAPLSAHAVKRQDWNSGGRFVRPDGEFVAVGIEEM